MIGMTTGLMTNLSEKKPGRVSVVAVLLTYLMGAVYWAAYFLKGSPTFTSNDWLKEQVFSNVLRESILGWQIPWGITPQFYHKVNEFIANPEVSLTPDVLLLAVLPNNAYFLAHTLIFYTIGFLGMLMLARRYELSSLPFVFFCVLFGLNGYVSAHLSEGHIQWVGCFLIPLFFYCLSDVGSANQSVSKAAALKLGLLLGFMFLNGSFHMAVWCLMFAGLALIYKPELFKQIGLVFLVAGLLWVCRLVPAGIYFAGAAGKDFVSGYPSFNVLLDAFTFIYNPGSPTTGGSFGQLKWHEYNFYIGYVGFAFLAVGLWAYLKNGLKAIPVWWLPSVIIMFMLSMGDVFQLIPNSGLPFSTLERVASRFIILPFFVVSLAAAVGFTYLQDKYRRPVSVALFLAIVPMLGEIFQHARKWRIESYESVMGTHQIPSVSIIPLNDGMLHWVVGMSWLVSFSVALVVVVWLWRMRNGRVNI